MASIFALHSRIESMIRRIKSAISLIVGLVEREVHESVVSGIVFVDVVHTRFATAVLNHVVSLVEHERRSDFTICIIEGTIEFVEAVTTDSTRMLVVTAFLR